MMLEQWKIASKHPVYKWWEKRTTPFFIFICIFWFVHLFYYGDAIFMLYLIINIMPLTLGEYFVYRHVKMLMIIGKEME